MFDLNCLDDWKTKHWKYLVCWKDVKANKSGRAKVCKAEEVKKYFVNSEIENEIFG